MGREVNRFAAKAHASYTAGKYDDALSHLSQLTLSSPSSGDGSSATTTSRDSATSSSVVAGQHDSSGNDRDGGEDFRMMHNRALCEHARNGFSDPAALEEALHVVRVQLRGKTRGADGQEEAEDEGPEQQGSAAGPTAAAAAGKLVGSSGGAAVAAAGLTDLNADASVLLFNLSALHFQQKQYGAAQAVLEHLFLHIEPVDESLAIHICFLLLDVLCHSARGNLHTPGNLRRFAQQSAAVVAFLERYAGASSSSGDSGGGDDGGNGGGGGGGSSGLLGGSGEQTEFAFRLHLYKAKVLLLQEQTKTSKKEIKSALEIFQRELRGSVDGGNGSAGVSGGGSSGIPVGGGGEAPQKTFTPVPPAGVQNMAALYLKANLEHLRDNHRKALKLLASCHGFQGAEEYSGPGEAVGPPYFNNMGCLHHKLRRHHVALHYFQKALESLGRGAESTAKENGTTSSGHGGGRAGGRGGVGGQPESDGYVSPAPTCEVLYNTGLQLLLTENPQEALRCFERAALLFHNRPHLWLRMAECSIADHRLRNKNGMRRAGGTNGNSGGGGGGGISGNFAPSSTTPRTSNGEVGGGGAEAEGGHSGGIPSGRRPLPWSTVGKGQYRRVLLPTNSTGGVNCAQGDGAPGLGGVAIPPSDEDIVVPETNGSVAGEGLEVASRGDIAGTARAGRGKRDRCSLAHASRCLHNVVYLCAARAKGARKAAAAGAPGLIGGQTSVLGVSARLVAKNLAATSGAQQASHGNNTPNATPAGGRDGRQGGNGAAADGELGPADGTGDEICQVALVDLAYVHLGLNDPVSALGYAVRVLGAQHVSAVNQHLAHVYAAEALCVLGRPNEALEHLSPLSEDTSTIAAAAAAGVWASNRKPGAGASPPGATTVPASAGGAVTSRKAGAGAAAARRVGENSGGAIGVAGDLSLEAAAEARASLHTNLAAVHSLQDNLALAERCARTAMGICPGSASVLRMAVYVLIRQGNVEEALQVLKEGRLSRK